MPHLVATDYGPTPLAWLDAAPEVDAGHGALFAPGCVAEEGVYVYVEDGRPVREYVTPAAIKAMAVLLPGAPIPLEHPEDPITPDNWRALAIGDVGEAAVVFDGVVDGSPYKRARILAPFAIRDGEAQRAMAAARERGDEVYVSPRHSPVRDNTPGLTPWGEPYDRARIGCDAVNHAAALIDSRPRGGPGCRVALDAADAPAGIGLLSTPRAVTDAAGDAMDPSAVLAALMEALADPEKAAALGALLKPAAPEMPEDAPAPADMVGKEEMDSLKKRVAALEVARTAKDAADAAERETARKATLSRIGAHFGLQNVPDAKALASHLRAKGVGDAADSDEAVIAIGRTLSLAPAPALAATDSTPRDAVPSYLL